jgi:hypothetical protein
LIRGGLAPPASAAKRVVIENVPVTTLYVEIINAVGRTRPSEHHLDICAVRTRFGACRANEHTTIMAACVCVQ